MITGTVRHRLWEMSHGFTLPLAGAMPGFPFSRLREKGNEEKPRPHPTLTHSPLAAERAKAWITFSISNPCAKVTEAEGRPVTP
jgi:hypothetical protein